LFSRPFDAVTKKRAEYYDQLGDKFEEYMSDYDVVRRTHLIFCDLIERSQLRGSKVLEIGSGTGRFSRRIHELGGELTVLDIGVALVNTLAQELSCDAVAGDTLCLPFQNDSYDAIISSECIEHTLDPELAIREMCRVCRPGGIVCLTTPNKLWYPALVLSQKLGVRRFAGIENWMFPHRAAAVMRQEGMGPITISGCHLWPFQLRFTRPLLRRLDNMGNWLYPLMINFGILGRKQA
jgi:ubiquinone/menaquinone biosynthesis C-methylase UbiE